MHQMYQEEILHLGESFAYRNTSLLTDRAPELALVSSFAGLSKLAMNYNAWLDGEH